jgi:hypothetical protein
MGTSLKTRIPSNQRIASRQGFLLAIVNRNDRNGGAEKDLCTSRSVPEILNSPISLYEHREIGRQALSSHSAESRGNFPRSNAFLGRHDRRESPGTGSRRRHPIRAHVIRRAVHLLRFAPRQLAARTARHIRTEWPRTDHPSPERKAKGQGRCVKAIGEWEEAWTGMENGQKGESAMGGCYDCPLGTPERAGSVQAGTS